MKKVLDNQKDEKSKLFDKDFFNAGKHAPGTFDYYSFEEYCLNFKPLCEIIKKHFNPKRVLDIGCAKGSFVYAFRQMGIEAFGVDISEYAISCAPESMQPFLRVVDLDKDSLPYQDGFFDFITFFGSIEYLHDDKHAIAEIERVLADGGSLLLTTLYKKPKGDAYRINIHKKGYWMKRFGDKWSNPKFNRAFLSDYFRKPVEGKSKRWKSVFGMSKFTDRVLIGLWDALTAMGVLSYGVILLTLSKEKS